MSDAKPVSSKGDKVKISPSFWIDREELQALDTQARDNSRSRALQILHVLRQSFRKETI